MQIRTSSYEKISTPSESGRRPGSFARQTDREIEVNPVKEPSSPWRSQPMPDSTRDEQSVSALAAVGLKAQRAVGTYMNLQQTLTAEERFDFASLAGVDFYA